MFIDVSIASIDESGKTAVQFQILLFFQTTDLLPHLFLVSINTRHQWARFHYFNLQL